MKRVLAGVLFLLATTTFAAVGLTWAGDIFDSGANRDAGSRFGVTIDGTTGDFYLGTGFTPSTTAGSSRVSIDKLVSSSEACPDRAFISFGTWSATP
jgi:hypothetical protein